MSQYDRQAEAWLRAKIPGANPKPGSVEFEISGGYDGERDYLSVGWQQTTTHQVPWGDPENSYQPRLETVPGDYWGGDITEVFREVMDFPVPEPEHKELTLNIAERYIGTDEHRWVRAAIREAIDNGVTTDLVVHSRRGASIVPTPQGR